MWQRYDILATPVQWFRTPNPRYHLVLLPDNGLTSDADPELNAWLSQNQVDCLVPLLADCWWSNRLDPDQPQQISSEAHLLEHLLPETFLVYRPLALIGIGAGGAGAIRLSLRHPDRFPIVGSLNAELDHFEKYGSGTSLDRLYRSREQCRQDSAVLHVHPSRHPRHLFLGVESRHHFTHRGNDRLHEKLNALGVAHRFEVLPGHSLWQQLLIFLQIALTEEGRRLL